MPPTIQDLPDPIIEYILSYLSPYKDLKQCMQVNRAWYRYVYDVIRKTQRDFYNAVCNMTVQWCHRLAEPGPTISKRYSHSACCIRNSMYIFGGCTTANTTFNDLWRLDLGTRCWIRPLATGTYPPPKACATLVCHEDNLVLFGGWTHTAPYPLHQVWRVFNQIHLYNTVSNRWTHLVSPSYCPPMAGHSASVHNHLMVVFGGIQRQMCDGPFLSSNDTWTLDLKTLKWQKQATSPVQPPPRYGHSQIPIDRHHLLIMGGCGGPNMLYTDIWLLKMTDDPDDVWEWQEMDVEMKENAAPYLAFHPACKVGSQVVVMSKTQKSRTTPSCLPHLLRAPSRIWVPPRHPIEDCTPKAPKPQEAELCINGKRGVLKRQKHDPASSSEEDESRSQEGGAKRSNGFPASREDAPPSTSGHQSTSGAGPPEGPASREGRRQGPPMPGPSAAASRRNRERRLERLDRMEQRLRELREATHSYPTISPFSGPFRKPARPSTPRNPMCMYVLDVGAALGEGRVAWRPLGRQSPCAPEEIILYSLVLGKGELVMFGGIQKDLHSGQQEGETVPEVVSNSLHFMEAQRFVI
ncbi:F-box only protein 42-like [Uloborus diversus]|uniref:F-box only protein 42-like n=1 Tax=Uloborus diversus TaxID=327109 RepID=UPI002409AA3B|nr:F-box only protein 42-like [Uloborus diversus]